MADELSQLSDDERAELEALRAEKAAREREEAAAAERAELERLRAEKAAAERAELENLRAEKAAAERSERAREIMEPDDDLSMPLPQRILIVALVLLFIFAVWRIFFAG